MRNRIKEIRQFSEIEDWHYVPEILFQQIKYREAATTKLYGGNDRFSREMIPKNDQTMCFFVPTMMTGIKK